MTPWLLVHLVATLIMVGIIWMVQCVHYPLMAHTGPSHSAAYQQQHVRRMGPLVIPVMLAELLASVALCVSQPSAYAWIALALLAVIWAVTGLSSVPAHEALSRGFDDHSHRKLMRSNALRTALWTARGVLATAMVIV